MISFPNCKINLGLYVTARRSDGYHNIETAFLPIPFYDVLECIRATDVDNTTFEQSGHVLNIPPEKNICLKAYALVKEMFPSILPVHMYLHKNIPAGAGLGGGSANAAFTIMALNSLYHLNLSVEEMENMALQLGSDCPFFIRNTPCIGKGRGEEFLPLHIDLTSYSLLVVNPGIHINTAWAFGKCSPAPVNEPIELTLNRPIEEWPQFLYNVFEPIVFSQHPQIALLKQSLYDAGAVYASMTGTGSTVFALFAKKAKPALQFPHTYFVKWMDDMDIRT